MTRTQLLHAAAATALLAGAAHAQTAFTYQGHLARWGEPADGQFDVEFSLWDASSGGNQVAGPVSLADLDVSGGLLTAEIDFGAAPFGQGGRFLEIVVDGTTLAPRQAITSTPTAVQTRGIFVSDPPGLFGFNNDAPNATVDITSTAKFGLASDVESDETNSRAIFGVVSGNGTQQRAVHGRSFSTGDRPVGGLFETLGTSGTGVMGQVFSGGTGVWGISAGGTEGVGVRAHATQSSGVHYALQAEADSPSGYAGHFVGGRSFFEGNVGIGTDEPARLLHVSNGSAGLLPNANSLIALERSNSAFVNVLCPDAFQSGVLFGNPTGGSAAGGVVFNSSATPQGLQFRVNGNLTRMALDSLGHLGVGTATPEALLHIKSGSTGAPIPSFDLAVLEGDNSPSFLIAKEDDDSAGYFFGTPSLQYPAAGMQFNAEGLSFSSFRGIDMIIDVNDNVGIATTTPGFRLEVNGTAGKPGGGSWSNSSDERLKKNVRPLTGALDTLLAIEGVRFEYRDPEAINELPDERIGVIAQQVERVVPDWVDENARGHKTVTFRGFEALTVEALREIVERQDREIAERDRAIEALDERVRTLEALVAAVLAGRDGGAR